MEKTTFMWVRHGQARADDNSYDYRTPLSELGRRQAESLADALVAGSPPDVVYASPYPRALATGGPFCRRLGIEPVVDERVAEFELPVPSLEEVSARPDLILWRSDHRGAEDGESLGEFSARVASFCEEVVERHPGKRVLVFAHSGTIDAALRWSLGFDAESHWQHDFDLANASITEMDFWPRGRVQDAAPRYTEIKRVGDATHLGDLASDF